jgi:hypothetical protein
MASTILSRLIGTLRSTFRIDRATLNASGLTAARTITLPDASLTVAGLEVAQQFTAPQTIAPATATPPLILSANAQGQLVTGLNADLLDGQDGAYYQNSTNQTAGTLPDARLSTNVPKLNAANTFTAVQTIAPATATPPLVLSANAQGQKVIGLNADLLDDQSSAYYQSSTNQTAGTLPDARLSTNVPKLNTANTFTAQQTLAVGPESLRLISNGATNRAYIGLYKLDASPSLRTGMIGNPQGATNELDVINEITGGHLVLGTDSGNIHLQRASFLPGAMGAAAGVIAIQNAATIPTANTVGGGALYVESGALKYRGSSGTTTTCGPAEPHCPRCGKDAVLEWENEAWPEKKKTVCVPCLLDRLTTLVPGLQMDDFTIP